MLLACSECQASVVEVDTVRLPPFGRPDCFSVSHCCPSDAVQFTRRGNGDGPDRRNEGAVLRVQPFKARNRGS